MSEKTTITLSDRGRMFAIIGIMIALVGLAISIYSTMHHLEVKATGATSAFCNINEQFSCDDVAKSAYSELFGIPLGIYGAGYFLGLLLLLGTALYRSEYVRDNLQTYSFLVGLGVVVSLTLSSISYFAVGALCLTCIGIYITTLLQAGVLFAFRSEVPGGWNAKGLSNGATYALIGLAVVVGLFQFIKPTSRDFKPDVPQTDEVLRDQANQQGGASILAPNTVELKIDRSAYSGLGEDYRKGPDNAKVTIVEFADFQCPACRYAFETMRQLKSEFGDRIQVVFKNYPLDNACNQSMNRRMHPFACDAARLGRCAGAKGNFWSYHDQVFTNQDNISADMLKTWAKGAGLNDQEIQECLASKDVLAKIQDDVAAGNKAGVDATPTLLINGRKVVGGRSLPDLRAEVQKLLGE